MHIALLSAEYPPHPGGVGDYTRCLGEALAAQGHQMTVLTSATAAAASGAAHNDPHVALWPVVPGWDWRCWSPIIAALDQLRPAVLHIQYQTGAYAMHPAINLLPWRLRGLPLRPRTFVTFHDTREPYLFPKAGWFGLRRAVTLRLARDADTVIATNAADAAALRQATHNAVQPAVIPIGSNIAVQPPVGYERAAWRATLGIPPAAFVVSYFGLLSHAKGFDLLLDAAEQLAPTLPCTLLLIGGDATTPHDRAYAATIAARLPHSPLGGRIIRTGHRPPPEVSACLLASDVVALPFRDGASLRSGSLLAALAHGVPVVTTLPTAAPPPPAADTDALPVLADGTHALLVPPADPAALAAALRRLAAAPALRAHLSANAQTVSAAFRWEQIAYRHTMRYTAC